MMCYLIKHMILFGEKIKKKNKVHVIIILVLAIIWRYFMGDGIQPEIGDPYVFPTLGFFACAIVFGEISRRLFRFFFKKKPNRKEKYIKPEINLNRLDKAEDKEALRFGIFWSIIWVVWTIL